MLDKDDHLKNSYLMQTIYDRSVGICKFPGNHSNLTPKFNCGTCSGPCQRVDFAYSEPIASPRAKSYPGRERSCDVWLQLRIRVTPPRFPGPHPRHRRFTGENTKLFFPSQTLSPRPLIVCLCTLTPSTPAPRDHDSASMGWSCPPLFNRSAMWLAASSAPTMTGVMPKCWRRRGRL